MHASGDSKSTYKGEAGAGARSSIHGRVISSIFNQTLTLKRPKVSGLPSFTQEGLAMGYIQPEVTQQPHGEQLGRTQLKRHRSTGSPESYGRRSPLET